MAYAVVTLPPRRPTPPTPPKRDGAPKKAKTVQRVLASVKKDFKALFKVETNGHQIFFFYVKYREDNQACTNKNTVTILANAEWKRDWKPLHVGAVPGSRARQPTSANVAAFEARIKFMREYDNTTVVSFQQLVRESAAGSRHSSPAPLQRHTIQPIIRAPAAPSTPLPRSLPPVTSGILKRPTFSHYFLQWITDCFLSSQRETQQSSSKYMIATLLFLERCRFEEM